MPDIGGNLPGRGAWVLADRAAIVQAQKSGAFKRAFKGKGTIVGDLDEVVEARLKDRAGAALGLARRAGAVRVGFDQVTSALRAKKVSMLVAASDASEGSFDKVRRLAQHLSIVRSFSGDELSNVLGRDGVRFVVLDNEPETDRFKQIVLRFERFSNRLSPGKTPECLGECA